MGIESNALLKLPTPFVDEESGELRPLGDLNQREGNILIRWLSSLFNGVGDAGELITKRWMAEVSYRDGTPPLILHFEELHALEDIIERGPDWNTIETIVITLNRPTLAPRRDEH
jgi:hypothetical protein